MYLIFRIWGYEEAAGAWDRHVCYEIEERMDGCMDVNTTGHPRHQSGDM